MLCKDFNLVLVKVSVKFKNIDENVTDWLQVMEDIYEDCVKRNLCF